MNVALLADRLRVEERLLAEELKSRGIASTLVQPASLSVNLTATSDPIADMVFDRGVSTKDSITLTTLLASNGATVINRPATGRLLSDRLALIRHLVIAGLPVPTSEVCFGEQAALDAIDQIGYPVVIKTLVVDPAFPSAFVEDRDSAEAIIEHRIVLGHDQTTLVQSFQRSLYGRSLRAIVIDDQPVGFDARPHDGWRPNLGEIYEPVDQVENAAVELANTVIARLGTGVYAILMIETDQGPVVTGVENLVTFRHLEDQGIDASKRIVDFSLSQLPVALKR